VRPFWFDLVFWGLLQGLSPKQWPLINFHRGKLFKNFLKAGGRNDPRINLDFVKMAARGRKQKASLL
jgi:hypothetical protein